MKKIEIDGRQIELSQEEMEIIVKRYFLGLQKIAETPTVGACFEIRPQEINKSTFESPRENQEEELLRNFIARGLHVANENPEKYSQVFYVMIPEMIWNIKTIGDLRKMPKNYGGEMQDWVQFALECAQRICNGEHWEDVCTYFKKMPISRLIKGETENDNLWILGYTMQYEDNLRIYFSLKAIECRQNPPYPARDTIDAYCKEEIRTCCGVPSVVFSKINN